MCVAAEVWWWVGPQLETTAGLMKVRKKMKARKALDNFHMVFFKKLADAPRIRGENLGKLYQAEFELWSTQVGGLSGRLLC